MTTSTRRPSGTPPASPASARAARAASRTRNCSGSPPSTALGMIPCAAGSNGIGRVEVAAAPAGRRGRWRSSRGRRRRPGPSGRAGRRRSQSRPARMFSQKAKRSPAPGNRQAMPTIATSSGPRRGSSGRLRERPAGRSGRRACRGRRRAMTSTSPLRPSLSSSSEAATGRPRAGSSRAPGRRGALPGRRPSRRPTTGPRSSRRPGPASGGRARWPACSGPRWPPRSRPGRCCRTGRRSTRRRPRTGATRVEQPGEVQGPVELGAEHAVERLGRLVAEQLVLDHPGAVDQADGRRRTVARQPSRTRPSASASRTSAWAYSTTAPASRRARRFARISRARRSA